MSPATVATPIIEKAGALCAVGRGIRQVYASVRADISRLRFSGPHDRWYEPIRMSLVPNEELEPLVPGLEERALSARLRRMLQLAGPALREASAGLESTTVAPPLFLGLPEPGPGKVPPGAAQLVPLLSEQTGILLNAAASQIFPRGRAAGLLALEAGVRHLAQGRAEAVLVGGLDSYLDLARLAELDREGRILGERVADGFVPGEGAAFLLLTSRRSRRQAQGPAVAVLGVGVAQDPGHRYSDRPALGEGLSFAIEKMIATLPGQPRPIQTTYAGFNGESFGAKEWGVARLRYADLFTPEGRIEHPADCFGDAGAALGIFLLALAHTALLRGHRAGPALVWASSDREDRACALLDLLA